MKLYSQKRCFPYSITKTATLCILFLSLLACAPQRRPLPLGQIPQPTKVTAQDEQAGHQILGELSQKYELDYNHPRRNEVDVIVRRLTEAIGASTYPWHVNVFSDPTVKNAAATKGNHIFVWTGIIDSTKNEDELAGILAHEIAHVLLKHTEPTDGETFRRVMIQIGAAALGTAAMVAVGGTGADMAGKIASSATQSVGEGLLINPYTRSKELEADVVGLYLVKKAGYNPEGVLNFWKRALYDPAFSSSIPFLSTHPPAQERLTQLASELKRIENMQITITQDQNPPLAPPGFPRTNKPQTNNKPDTKSTNAPNLPNPPPSPSLPNPNMPADSNFPKSPEHKVDHKSTDTRNTTPNNSDPFSPQNNAPLEGIKSEAPLSPGDSFEVPPDIMRPNKDTFKSR